ncbi:hypothetical protein MED121_01970 [Marinomonas sp. MED121]|nr:hypothetical protein MED121_01970 [Marinomonas sp. MED121]
MQIKAELNAHKIHRQNALIAFRFVKFKKSKATELKDDSDTRER